MIALCYVVLGVELSFVSDSPSFEEPTRFYTAAGVSLVTVICISRCAPSELAFGWLFFFGLFCLGLSLTEILFWKAPIYPSNSYDYYEARTLRGSITSLIPVVITLVTGLAHIIVALIRDFLLPRHNPRK